MRFEFDGKQYGIEFQYLKEFETDVQPKWTACSLLVFSARGSNFEALTTGYAHKNAKDKNFEKAIGRGIAIRRLFLNMDRNERLGSLEFVKRLKTAITDALKREGTKIIWPQIIQKGF